jgi:hypothetical protein
MRPVRLAVAGLLLTGAAWGTTAVWGTGVAWAQQRPPIQETPLPPSQRQWQQQALPPLQPNPVAPGGPGSQGQTQMPAQIPGATPTPPAVVERPNVWLPAAAVRLQALDKVNAQASALTIKVGQSATFGSLTITAKACVTRPADQPVDAAAFLGVTDSHPDSPGFDGWMLQAEPSVSMMQHPIYDLRVTGCA